MIGRGGTMKPQSYQFPQLLGEEPNMLYFFTDGTTQVPPEVAKDDIVCACLKHTAKLAKLVLQTMDTFPYDSCPSKACSVEGARHWNLELSDFLEMSGFPRDWMTETSSTALDQAYRLVAQQFDAVDRQAIEKISEYAQI